MKCKGSTLNVHLILADLSAEEASGIPSVAVKCVEIRKNTGGEGDFLDEN